jgi:hypothetical protein
VKVVTLSKNFNQFAFGNNTREYYNIYYTYLLGKMMSILYSQNALPEIQYWSALKSK